MTNPSHKKTKEILQSEIQHNLPSVVITGEYVNTDTKIEYECTHGKQYSLPWQLKKAKYCCRKGYYESGKMWMSNTLSDSDIFDRITKKRSNICLHECFISQVDGVKYANNIRCTIHNSFYSSGISIIGLCPECNKDRNISQLKACRKQWEASEKTGFCSKAETKWLDSFVNSIERQRWLPDVKYKVDGYDPSTNTVYLYHGRFWHGCPKTYDPEMIHPIIKIKMKDLYEKTVYYEDLIKSAGYKLVVKWGR